MRDTLRCTSQTEWLWRLSSAGVIPERQLATTARPSSMDSGTDGLGNQGIVEEGFEPQKTFLGARSGFVFKKGLWGVGYYVDHTNQAAQAPRRPRPPDGVVRPQASRCNYEVLGVAMLAGDDELRKAYRQMALKVRAGVLPLAVAPCRPRVCAVRAVAPGQEPGQH